MRCVTLLLLFMVTSGCLAAPSPTPVPPAVEVAEDCRAGDGEVFLSTISGGGFVPQSYVPRLVEITHDGELRAVQGHTREGSGNIREETPGAMRGLDHATILAMLARANLSIEGRDLVVTNGSVRLLALSEFDMFCDSVAGAYASLAEEYPNTNCADQGSTTWRISMRQGDKTVFVDDCAAHAETPRALIAGLRALVDHAE